jgi:transposase
MFTPPSVVGIDVSKAWLDGMETATGASWRVANTPAGWQDLIARMPTNPPPLIVLEATGPYHQGVTVALDAAGFTPAVVNPLKIRRFIQSHGYRAKTDRADARMVARYGQQVQPVPQPVPPPSTRTLQALISRRRDLTHLLVMEKNRTQQTTDPVVAASLARTMANLVREQQRLDGEIARVVAADAQLAAASARLRTAPGIGVLLAPTLVAALPELGSRTGKELAALVGLAPYARESGQQHGPRTIAGGRAAVRCALYQAATTAVRCNPVLRAHYQHLRTRGKAHTVAVIACARRLLGILNAMVRDNLTWDQTAVGQGRFVPD